MDTNKREGYETAMAITSRGISWLQLVKTVFGKMGCNTNSYASLAGLIWALISNKLHFGMPGIIEGCIQIMSAAGTGTAMFSMGLFMGQQEKLIACGPRLTLLGMLLRFVLGPAAMAIGCFMVGLHDDTLPVAIIQAAIPQFITSFMYAREYRLHANVLSTALIFGMLVSLPWLIGTYFILSIVH